MSKVSTVKASAGLKQTRSIGNPPPKTQEGDTIYTVKSGDNMTRIARDHDMTLAELEKANPQIENASKIWPGDQVRVPGMCVQETPKGCSEFQQSYAQDSYSGPVCEMDPALIGTNQRPSPDKIQQQYEMQSTPAWMLQQSNPPRSEKAEQVSEEKERTYPDLDEVRDDPDYCRDHPYLSGLMHDDECHRYLGDDPDKIGDQLCYDEDGDVHNSHDDVPPGLLRGPGGVCLPDPTPEGIKKTVGHLYDEREWFEKAAIEKLEGFHEDNVSGSNGTVMQTAGGAGEMVDGYIDAAVDGDTRELQDYQDKALEGEYGTPSQKVAEAGEYWSENSPLDAGKQVVKGTGYLIEEGWNAIWD